MSESESGSATSRRIYATLAGTVILLIATVVLTHRSHAGNDAQTQASLRSALADAENYNLSSGSYSGFDAASAQKIDSNLSWGSGPAKVGVVSVDYASGPLVIMSMRSSQGGAFCIADDTRLDTVAPQPVYGTRDAVGQTSLASCGTTNGWGGR